eukprot:scaffold659350_cov88-Prasinocladus_malaysianus.AAC.2
MFHVADVTDMTSVVCPVCPPAGFVGLENYLPPANGGRNQGLLTRFRTPLRVLALDSRRLAASR